MSIENLDKQAFSTGVDADDIAWMWPADFEHVATEGGQWIFQNLA